MKQLSIKEVASEAAWRYWGLRRELLSVMIIPIAGFLAIDIGASVLDMNGTVALWGYRACYLIVSTAAAISCHRLLLLGPVSVPKFGIGHLGMRELRFIAAMLFLCLIPSLLQPFTDLLLTSITGIGDSKGERRSLILTIVSWLPSSYLFARLAFMLPSIAIETRARIPEAWQLSSGNGWRLVLLIVLMPWLVRLLHWNLTTAIPDDTVGTIANTTLYALFLPLEIALLSVSYRHLVK
jgi:hypothetical protein